LRCCSRRTPRVRRHHLRQSLSERPQSYHPIACRRQQPSWKVTQRLRKNYENALAEIRLLFLRETRVLSRVFAISQKPLLQSARTWFAFWYSLSGAANKLQPRQIFCLKMLIGTCGEQELTPTLRLPSDSTTTLNLGPVLWATCRKGGPGGFWPCWASRNGVCENVRSSLDLNPARSLNASA
jgi:hypothetical protein